MCTKPTNGVSVEKETEVSNHVSIPLSNHVINLDEDTNEEEDPTGSRGKRKSGRNEYDSELDKYMEAANTDLVFSYGDYEYDPDGMNKRICKTVNNLNMQIRQNIQILVLPDAWTNLENVGRTTDLSNPMRGYMETAPEEGLHEISKKLFPSPFTTPPSNGKRKKGSSSGKRKKAMTGSGYCGARRCRNVLPKVIFCIFFLSSYM
jgi:hypothetical protein